MIDARKQGIKVSHLALLDAIRDVDTVIISEENSQGQYASMIEHLLTGKKLIRVNHVGGLVPPKKIFEAIVSVSS